MSYVGYGQSPYVQEPKIRFDAIGEAWAMTREKMGVWVVAMLIFGAAMLLVYAVVGGILFAAGLITAPSTNNPDWLSLPASLILNFVIVIAAAFFQAGIFRMALKQVRGQDIQTSDLFSAGDVVGGAIITQFLYQLGVTIGTYLCLIPGLIVSGRCLLALPLCVDKGVTGMDALKRSWEATKNDTLNAILFAIVAGLVSSLGVLLCGVGGLFTAPIYYLAIAITYRDFFDTEAGVRGPTLDMPLPPASAYAPGRFDAPGIPGQPLPYGQNPGDMSGGGRSSDNNGTKPPTTPGQMGSLEM